MMNTRKRLRKEEDPVKVEEKRPKLLIEKKNKANVKVKVESDQSLSPTTTLNALTVQQPFASAIIFGVHILAFFTIQAKVKTRKQLVSRRVMKHGY